jgi:hypothetical protein
MAPLARYSPPPSSSSLVLSQASQLALARAKVGGAVILSSRGRKQLYMIYVCMQVLYLYIAISVQCAQCA